MQGITAINAIAFKYKNGVIAALDTGTCYGTTRFSNTQRIFKPTKDCVCLFTGVLSDIEFLKKFVKQELESEEDRTMDPQGIHKMIQRILYQKRSEGTPLPVQVIVCGLNKKQNTIFSNTDEKGRMIGAINSKGNFWFESSIALSFSSHLSLPILRNFDSEQLEKEDAVKLMEECFRILCYKDCRSTNQIQMAVIDEQGVSISEPYSVRTDWMIGLREGEVLLQ